MLHVVARVSPQGPRLCSAGDPLSDTNRNLRSDDSDIEARIMAQEEVPESHQALHHHADSGSHLTSADLAQDRLSSPAGIKQEPAPTPRPASPVPESALNAFKAEHSMHLASPLRESSIPVPSTETPPSDVVQKKKRPAPSKTKKGTASAAKAPAVKRSKKLDSAHRSGTPSLRVSKPSALKVTSAKGTPVNSSPAPSSTRSASADPDDDVDAEEEEDDDDDFEVDKDDGNLYCLCRKPDTGSFMIGCDGNCDDWFHGKCVGIQERDKSLIDKYFCPSCTEGGAGLTTWKRMCRRKGCRQPARAGSIKGGLAGSKYCSDDCGVLHFRQLAAKTRDFEDSARERSSRRRGQADRAGVDISSSRGGLLSAAEVTCLLGSSERLEQFHELGRSVVDPADSAADGKNQSTSQYTPDELDALTRIAARKEEARNRHQLLKDRMRFITMAKQAAVRTASDRELKPKDYCGYDSRIEWTDEQFHNWQQTPAGQQAMNLESLQPTDGLGAEMEGAAGPSGTTSSTVCDRKKCARHLEWGKLAVDDVRFEMADNSDSMRGYDKEEHEVRERAALRANGGLSSGQGTVEMHEFPQRDGDGMHTVAMDVDPVDTTVMPLPPEDTAMVM